MKNVEAIKLIETVGSDTAIRVAESMGSSKTLTLVKNIAKRISKEKAQAELPGITGVTDGVRAVPLTGQKLRSKQNADYAAVYANVPNAFLPLGDVTYESTRVLSQHRNGNHVIYKALHMLNVLHRRGATALEVWTLLQSAPKCGGHAKFIKLTTVSMYLSQNNYGLWRKSGEVRRVEKYPGAGRPAFLYVASGLTVACGRMGRKKKAA